MLLAFLLSIWIASASTSTNQELYCKTQNEMGTPFKICLYSDVEPKQDFKDAFLLLRKIDLWMSDWKENTALSQVNQNAGIKPIKIPKELFQLLKYTLRISEVSNGAFDPTFNVFWGLYNFKKGQEKKPSQEQINKRLPLLNYRYVQLSKENSTAFLKLKGMKLGLGGIGQGYGVDQIVQLLKKRGYKAGYVDGSGDTYFWGKKPNGSLWTTGVRDPFDHSKIVGRIYGTDFAITTCGDDEKYFIENGIRYHHILDPKTGHPARKLRQVTVIAKHAVDADAFDTAAFVLGLQKGVELLQKQKLRGIFIEPNKKVTLTKGLKKISTKWGEAWVIDYDH